MSIDKRSRLYEVVEVDSNFELDYLQTSLENLDLETIRTYRIPQAMEYRPDLISYKFYGNFNLGWLIALHNDMLDPVFGFESGKEIDIPSMDQYFRFYSRSARRRNRR